jgi:hypothetical protein
LPWRIDGFRIRLVPSWPSVQGRTEFRETPFLDRIDRSGLYISIRTWFDLRSREELETVFPGPLPGYLNREGRQVLYYGGLTDIDQQFDAIESDLRKIQSARVAPEVAFLRPVDRWKVGLLCLTVRHRIRILLGPPRNSRRR